MTIDAMLRALRQRSGGGEVRITARPGNVRVTWSDMRRLSGFEPMAAEFPTLREALKRALAWYAAQEQEQEQPAEATPR